ncbi:hypothetical protein AVEN_248881-1 [Araneus ventricosus]|uniref:Uncharacterized protein n=1 Tax=Araneus ventricosus TaxID=182803 RepID=A0A4Y2V5H4_ARAVE|nr:hypothetical protein AVEN_248881-1 [Araneus ventricosus]
MRLGYQPIDTPGTEMYHPSNGSPRTANTWGSSIKGTQAPYSPDSCPHRGVSGEQEDPQNILKYGLPVEERNKIKTVRRTQKGGLAVVFHKAEDVSGITDKILSSEGISSKFSARPPGKRHPSLIIYDGPSSTDIKHIQIAASSYSEDSHLLRLRFKMRGKDRGHRTYGS